MPGTGLQAHAWMLPSPLAPLKGWLPELLTRRLSLPCLQTKLPFYHASPISRDLVCILFLSVNLIFPDAQCAPFSPSGRFGAGLAVTSFSRHAKRSACCRCCRPLPALVPSLFSPPPDGSASQVQHLPSSQVLWPDEAVCLRKKKRHPRQDPFARLSALKDDLCHRQLPEDQTAILNSVDHDDTGGHATLL